MSEAAAPGVVVGIFEDEVRAEQAVRALEVWRAANRRAGVGPIAVVARRVSGSTTWRARGVSSPGRAIVAGLVAGLALLGLPTAGAAALAAWAVASVVLGLAGLVGAVPAGQVGGLVLTAVVGSATVLGLLAGLGGAAAGCAVGLVVCFLDRQVRGLSPAEVALTGTALPPGGWAAVARVQRQAEPLVWSELARLGAVPAGRRPALSPADPGAACAGR